MNYKSAMQKIRRKCRKGSSTMAVFKAICENRYSHPVRDWAIFDLQRKMGWGYNTAVANYTHNLKRLYEIFAVPLPLELARALYNQNDLKSDNLESEYSPLHKGANAVFE